jgi:hypothetical protein
MKLVLKCNADHEEDTLDNIYERRGMMLVSLLLFKSDKFSDFFDIAG